MGEPQHDHRSRAGCIAWRGARCQGCCGRPTPSTSWSTHWRSSPCSTRWARPPHARRPPPRSWEAPFGGVRLALPADGPVPAVRADPARAGGAGPQAGAARPDTQEHHGDAGVLAGQHGGRHPAGGSRPGSVHGRADPAPRQPGPPTPRELTSQPSLHSCMPPGQPPGLWAQEARGEEGSGQRGVEMLFCAPPQTCGPHPVAQESAARLGWALF